MTRRVLFVSNGVGEDLIASRLIEEFDGDGLSITACPLVGLGVYRPDVPLLEPRRAFPSGGFSLREGLRGLTADLRAGLVGHWRDQRRTLRAQRGRFDLVVTVGDVYCLWMAAHAHPRPAFVATADSIRVSPFGWQARWVMRRCARQIFARDPDTAAALAGDGLPAVSLGNIMLDLLRPRGETFGLRPDVPVVVLLPGSRPDAVGNAVLLGQTASAVAAEVRETEFLLAVAPTLTAAALRRALGTLPGARTEADGALRIAGARVHLTTAFADALARGNVVLGMAGTAHEQAAALGRPVVGFPGHGSQFGPQFLRSQRRLLGEALVPARDWRDAARAVVRLLRDAGERERRGAIGRQRMGPPGGAQRTADALRTLIQNG
ncbi:MAG: lipid-A-disaccharide synthase-related protein [Armatimonadota bacterium]|nr:lipid-A-disaccharide synthase-related protein [Armatimonadota bacterium]